MKLLQLPIGIANMPSLTLFELDGMNKLSTSLRYEIHKSLERRQLHQQIIHIVHDVHEAEHGWCSSIVSLGKLTCQYLEIRDLHNVKRQEDAERAKL